MKTELITLKEAYIIENLKVAGVTNEKLIQINDETMADWEELIDSSDFAILKELAVQDKDKYVSIIEDGYQVKFLTIYGLINLIQLKFNKKRDVDFVVHEDGISDLILDESLHPKVTQFLSLNWKVIADGDRLAIRSINS